MTDLEALPESVEERGLRFLESLKGVSNPEVTGQISVAGGTLLSIKYKRNGIDTWEWYFENKKIPKSVKSTLEVAKLIELEVQPRSLAKLISNTEFPELIKMLIMSFLTIIFSFAVLFLVIYQPDNKSVQIVTGLLGLTLGYFVSKTDK